MPGCRPGYAGPVIGEVDRCLRIPRLFKYMNRKTGGASMAKMGPHLGELVAFLVTMAACVGSNAPAAQSDIGVTSNSILLGNAIARSAPARPSRTLGNPANATCTYIT